MSHTGNIASAHKTPGQGVSADGMESGTSGRLFTTKGSPTKAHYKYVSFWVDHATSFIYTTFHTTKAATEFVASKREFESWAAQFGVKIQSIRADNGVYTVQPFKEACKQQQQLLTYCGIGAHWQNGIAERFIGVITERACSILLHAMVKCPDIIKEDMWTFAVQHSVLFHNESIRKNQKTSPYYQFTGQNAPWSIADFKVFGSPAYVLDKAVKDGNNISMWASRVWQGVYIGPSTCHSSNVPIIYNPHSTHVSPQFQVIHDNNFHTATGNPQARTNFFEQQHQNSLFLFKDKFSETPYLFNILWENSVQDTISNSTLGPHKRPREYQPILPQANHMASQGSASTHITPAQGAQRQSSRGSISGASYATSFNLDDIPDALQPQVAQAISTQNTIHRSQSRPQYQAKPLTETGLSYKRLKQIDGSVYVLVAPFHTLLDHPDIPNQEDSTTIHSCFSSFLDTPHLDSQHLIACTAVDNKADTLTQGQMFKSAMLNTSSRHNIRKFRVCNR